MFKPFKIVSSQRVLKMLQLLHKKFITSITYRGWSPNIPFLTESIPDEVGYNLVTVVVPDKYLCEVVGSLKRSSLFQFKILGDVCVTDYFIKTKRFELSYNFLSIKKGLRLILKTYVSGSVQSVANIFKSALWLEREAWDMFGVFFINHPDLRRILTDYGFDGFPMRKDFPLTGYVEVRYDDSISSIVYEPLEMSQEYRLFNFISPWEKVV
jgi:NADH-quinone oxidoreductase subunit C